MTIKEKLNAKLEKLNTRREELLQSIVSEENKETRAALGETLKALKDDIAGVEEMLEQVDEPAGGSGNGDEGASVSERGKLNPVATMQTRGTGKVDEGTGSLEYRKAFQKFIATGKMARRADEVTTTDSTNVGTVIPENLVNKILEKCEELGTILNLVTKTAFPVGQSIPTDSVKPTATWVDEGESSDSQKKTLGVLITFTHHKLRCEIRMSEEVSVMTLSAFEDLFVKQVSEAMVRAKEQAIISGNGQGKPTGILNAAAPESQAITGTSYTYALLCEAEAALPEEYEAGARWAMTKKTFMKWVGMVDENGQPIARINHGVNGKPERYLLGREVCITSAMANQSVDAIIFDFSDYVLNSNYNLGVSHAIDWDNEDHKTKAVEACDGKCIDRGSLVTVKVTPAAPADNTDDALAEQVNFRKGDNT